MRDLAAPESAWNSLAALATAADHALFLRSLGLRWDCACADCSTARGFVAARAVRLQAEAMLARTMAKYDEATPP